MRRLDGKVAAWIGVAVAVLAAMTVAYALSRREAGGLENRGQFALGLGLGAICAAIYSFSLRKWALVFLYRYQIFRPAEIAQDAATRAKGEIEDLQRSVDAGVLRAASDIKMKAHEILVRFKVQRAFRVALEPRAPAAPRIELVRRESFGKLEQWLLGHATLGAVAIAATLYHADFKLGGPVSAALTITFLGAAVTGIYGGYLYWVVPSRLSAHEEKLGFEDTRRQIERVDEELHAAHEKKDEDLAKILALERDRLLDHYRPQLRRKRQLEAWLIAHVPLAAAALALLVVHVLSVWWY